jgi:hypothetical protein
LNGTSRGQAVFLLFLAEYRVTDATSVSTAQGHDQYWTKINRGRLICYPYLAAPCMWRAPSTHISAVAAGPWGHGTTSMFFTRVCLQVSAMTLSRSGGVLWWIRCHVSRNMPCLFWRIPRQDNVGTKHIEATFDALGSWEIPNKSFHRPF